MHILLAVLIRNIYSNRRYFRFGISTEKGGTVLNEGLLAQKEDSAEFLGVMTSMRSRYLRDTTTFDRGSLAEELTYLSCNEVYVI